MTMKRYSGQLADLAGLIHHACTFTGHRPNKLPWRYNEKAPRCIALQKKLVEQIAALADNGYTHFLSGMALGVDCWCSQIALDLRERNPALKLHCLLPCEGQEAKWPASSQKRYHAILERADSIVYVNREYNDKCMLERDRALVQSSSLLLAVYDGSFRSGTGATVRYARKLGRELIVIDPVTLAVTYEKAAP